jgi:hypothetical protein
MPCCAHVVPLPYHATLIHTSMSFPCHAMLIHTCHAMPLSFSEQCHVLRESPHGSQKYPNCQSYSLTDWYASDNRCGTLYGSWKKPNAGRSPTCHLWTADANSHMPCPCCAVPWPWEVVFRRAWSWHGMGTAGVKQTWPHCVNQMGKTQSKLLAARHGRGMAWYVWISLMRAMNAWNSGMLGKL